MKSGAIFSSLFHDADHSLAYAALAAYRYPWEALRDLKAIIERSATALPRDMYREVTPGVWVAHTAEIAPSAYLGAPCVICEGAVVRHAAFIRGAALVGRGAVVGNSVELKNCVLFDEVQVPHFNYVGDSILGYRAHMGAGAVISNVKGDKSCVTVRIAGESLESGCRKCGALIGDYAEIGCQCVLNPGTVIGRHAQVYPLSSVRGYVPDDHIYKSPQNIVKRWEK